MNHITYQAACQTASHCESDACTIVVFIKLHELIENALGLGSRYADTRIFDDELYAAVNYTKFQNYTLFLIC